jgi:hypothetical protein
VLSNIGVEFHVLIGGWAVFIYNSYFGSVDIDVVGPSLDGRFLEVIERFERTHGYEEVQSADLGIEVAYRKPIVKKGRHLGFVEIDACTFEADTGGFHEDDDKKLPYALCGDPQLVRSVNFDEESAVYLPRKRCSSCTNSRHIDTEPTILGLGVH